MKKTILLFSLLITGLILIGLHFILGAGGNSLKLDIQTSKVIMPAAYKVYANPDILDGKYYLFKMLVTNDGNKPIDDIKVSFRIPKFIEWTDIQTIKRLNPGQSAVVCCYPVFDDKIVDKTTSSREKTEIRLTAGSFTREEEFAFEMKGRNDFVYTSVPTQEISSNQDLFDNDPLLACFITPEDPIIQYYTQQIQEKMLKGEQASVSKDPEEALRFLMGIYNATLNAHMVYSGTNGFPSGFGDVQSIVQHLRLPREVVTGNTGLCIELSLLYCSILFNEGLEPIIYMIPGHAYPGFRLNGQYFAIEATGIGGEGLGNRASAGQALIDGTKELEQFIKAQQAGDPRYTMLDVTELIKQKHINPMELKDDAFLRQKIDEIATTFNQTTRIPIKKIVTVNNTFTPKPAVINPDNNTSLKRYNDGKVSFAYPIQWNAFSKPNPQFSMWVSQIVSPDKMASIEVWELTGSGFSNNESALSYLKEKVFRDLRYQYIEQRNNGFQLYSASYQNIQWILLLRPNNGGITCLAIGSDHNNFPKYQGVFNYILSTVK